MKLMRRFRELIILFGRTSVLKMMLCGLFLLSANTALAETVSFPLTLDFQVLNSLVAKTAYPGENQSVLLIDEGQGCRRVVLSEPHFSKSGHFLKFETRVFLRVGANIGSSCVMPVEWEGYLVISQLPVVQPDTWKLFFKSVDSHLETLDHQPDRIAGMIWSLFKTKVYGYLNAIQINLAPPVSELKDFLLPLFQKRLQAAARKMVANLRIEDLGITPQGLQVMLQTEIDPLALDTNIEQSEVISEQEIVKFVELWELWDAYLVHIITALSEEPLSEEDRQILMDVLLEARYEFSEGLTAGNLPHDFVRKQFVNAWSRLGPIFRHHLGDDPSRSILGYLSFFTASDALAALDRIGPGIGIEISRNGLIRLAKLVSGGKPMITGSSEHLRTILRRMLGFGPEDQMVPLKIPPADIEKELNPERSPEDEGQPFSQLLKGFFFPRVWAADSYNLMTMDEIKSWLLNKDNLSFYMLSVRGLLDTACNQTPRKKKIPRKFRSFFPMLVQATAWQESCFRQFHIKKGKIVSLRSYNGSSVGIMQINERVWRGLYDLQRLRWDIRYNIRAGCEILLHYTNRYAIRKLKQRKLIKDISPQTLAQIVYALYNGGPRQFDAFLKRRLTGKYYFSDNLFLEKYIWVKQGQWEKVRLCVIGGA